MSIFKNNKDEEIAKLKEVIRRQNKVLELQDAKIKEATEVIKDYKDTIDMYKILIVFDGVADAFASIRK